MRIRQCHGSLSGVLNIAACAFLGLVMAGEAMAQADPPPSRLPIDLAVEDSSIDVHVGPGSYTFQLVNAIPGEIYSVVPGATISIALPPLSMPAGPTPPPAEGANCTRAARVGRSLVEVTDESDIPQLRRAARVALLDCADSSVRRELENLVAATVRTDDTAVATVRADSRTTVTIRRGTKKWDITLSAATRGQWQTMVGFVFAPKRDREYFSRPNDDGSFTIREKTGEVGWKRPATLLPSILWTWLPTESGLKSLQHGLAAGVGVATGEGLGRAAVLGGYSIRYNQNVGVVFGVALYAHERLDGKYMVDDIVAENLESDQLSAKETRANVFVGLTLRFGGIPGGIPGFSGG